MRHASKTESHSDRFLLFRCLREIPKRTVLWAFLTAVAAVPAFAAGEPPAFTLTDAREQGTDKTGLATGAVVSSYDEVIKKDILDFTYTLPQGSDIRVWVRNFPEALTADTANTVKIDLMVPHGDQVKQIAVKLELKGSAGTQTLPLEFKRGRNAFQKPIDWTAIGTLSEAAFVVSPAGAETSVSGVLNFALEFLTAVPAGDTGDTATAGASSGAPAASAKIPSSFNLLDALDTEIISTGTAKGTVLPTYDEVAEKDVLEFDYSLTPSSSLTVLFKNFPATLGRDSVNTAKIGLRTFSSDQAAQMAVTVELKGANSTQTIPLKLRSGWNALQQAIEWEAIGPLNTVSVILTPAQNAASIKGTVSFTLEFIKQAALAKTTGMAEGFVASYSLFDASQKGVFNIGPSQGASQVTFDETRQKDVFAFTYTVPAGSFVGIWTQDYPAELMPCSTDAVKIGVMVPNAEQVNQVSVKVELKSENSWQTIPLRLKPGWNSFREIINWNAVGNRLKEAVFVVSPTGATSGADALTGGSPIEVSRTEAAASATGTLYFDLEFGKMTFWQKYFPIAKTGLIFVISLLFALISGFLGKSAPDRLQATGGFSGGKRNLVYGISSVMIAVGAIWVYSLGQISALDLGFNFSCVFIGLLGLLAAWLLKSGLTGKPLSPSEVFLNTMLSGFLAAASSRQELWQAPATWTELLTISNLTATLVFLIYHIWNLCSLASSGKHLKTLPSVLIVGTPFIFGWLLLLQNITLLQTLGNIFTLGMLASKPAIIEVLGRMLVVFVFNEIVINGLCLLLKGKSLKTGKAHGFVALVSLGVVIAPLVADLGSTSFVASLPTLVRALIAIITVMLSYAGLWAEVYLITGIFLDGGKRTPPSWETIWDHVTLGAKKAMAFSGILVAMIYVLFMMLGSPVSQKIMSAFPIVIGVLAGALIFPLLKTIIETFDGSVAFFERVRESYKNGALYGRGMVAGFGFAAMCTQGMFQQAMSSRIVFGCLIGLFASSGVSFLRDLVYAFKRQGRIQTWKLYFVDGCLGAFIGSAAAFYLDARQVPVIVEKFKLYTSSGFNAVSYMTYPLVNKWGRMDLGTYTGGVKLLFTESLAGVINWAIAAWLFAINKVFMQAYFEKHTAPIKFFFSKAGFAQLIEHMIYVLRWGLWMSPIIFTFLRMMPDPTWYNQDGAIRTLVAIFNNLTMSPEGFRSWSLAVFVYVMAFDFFRVLIWMDHMGLRVATLVNLSFLGLDRLDERLARFIGPAAAQRYIPDAVKRFATWAPLLIPFYLPRGKEWDYAWNTSESIQNSVGKAGLVSTLQSMSLPEKIILTLAAVAGATLLAAGLRALHARAKRRSVPSHVLGNREYRVVLKDNGEIYSEAEHRRRTVYPPTFDITRRSYNLIDPCGRILFLADMAEGQTSAKRYWPVLGNYPAEFFQPSEISQGEDFLKITNVANGVRTQITVTLPDEDTTAELWQITVENLTDQSRKLKVVPYLEWVLNGGLHDRFHTQYQRLFPEMEYAADLNAMLTWNKSTKAMGILAVDSSPEGLLNSRMDFIGRARSIWKPRALETFEFMPAENTARYPTFDPIGSLVIDAALNAKASKTIRLMIGYAKNRDVAVDMVRKLMNPKATKVTPSIPVKRKSVLVGHGEIPPGTPQPYSEFLDHGNKIRVKTLYTPRPYDHAMSNAAGHCTMVTNRGLLTSSNGNSQQNRLTPDWPDTVTCEVPSEAIYLYDTDESQWYSPTFHPLNDTAAKHESEFSVDGTAVFRMSKGVISTELTVFVPPDDPLGVYLLTVKNNADKPKRMRVASYFEMVLEFQPERSGTLQVRRDTKLNALFFENPRQMFRTGWAFASMTHVPDLMETKRGRFFGTGRSVSHPFIVEKGKPDTTQLSDDKQIAGLVGTLDIPARGECTVAVILGQTDEWKQAVRAVEKYRTVPVIRESLQQTRKWWLNLMSTMKVETNHQDFDEYLNWLKYQALAERIWARRGFYQTSGAYGFRDQLQDTVNLVWVDPALARQQILLCASHQFLGGDVYHWFFTLTDGRTAFSCRSHASDNPLWIAWAVGEYVKATGDESLLDEMAAYQTAQFPFADLPKNKGGWGHLYHRSMRADSVYQHCLRSIDLVFDKRMGEHGLPQIRTGDWNDGLDEIGSEGKGESIWLGFFLYYIMKDMLPIIEKKEGSARKEHYAQKMQALATALEGTWRDDRYLRAIHDDGTEIGVKNSGVWEIDALTAAWCVMTGINPERELIMYETALRILEKENVILLGWPALREDTKPYLGRSSKYPEGVRENGMYCHGTQWLIRAARILAERFAAKGDEARAAEYRETAYRLWRKITPLSHVVPGEIEIYGGQPNKQPADILTNFDQGRMIWHGYTGAAGWLLREAYDSVVGASLRRNELVLPDDFSKPRDGLRINRAQRDMSKSPLLKTAKPDTTLRKEMFSSPSRNKISTSSPEVPAGV